MLEIVGTDRSLNQNQATEKVRGVHSDRGLASIRLLVDSAGF